ncbi:hypothetical protein DH2020_025044 [Rehmannia glutinosa]|uniref:X8 domain-containing protein n=1 Tax=Rehmannia glutinosa TaxID=99300 RepID=A0ABR0W397_REHGL
MVVGFRAMRLLHNVFMLFIFFVVVSIADGGSIGVNYGRIANNLPSAAKVVNLLKSQGLDRVKVYDSDPAVLKALSGSGIKVTVNLPNELLSSAARRPSFAYSWVKNNVAAYHPSTAIEALPSAMKSSSTPTTPRATSFRRYIVPVVGRLVPAGSNRTGLQANARVPPKTGSSLMINVYPFFAYESNADVIPLDYALFRENPGVVDGGNGLRYFSLFDAQIDAVFAAMSALKYDDVPIIVSETGWPSKGDSNELGATVENAAAYNGNLVRRVLSGGGTPLRPHADLTVYLFALFNENKKVGPTSERNFGLFYPDEKKVYDIPFTAEGLKGYRDNSPAPVTGGEQRVSTANGQTWCVAKGEAGKDKLQAGLDYACGEGGADCHPIQPGSTCFDPNTLEAHASFAFNSYYQKKGRAFGTCFFGGAAYIVSQQPSEYLNSPLLLHLF